MKTAILTLLLFCFSGVAMHTCAQTKKTPVKAKTAQPAKSIPKRSIKPLVVTDTAKVYRDRQQVKYLDFRPPSPTSPTPNNPNPHDAQPAKVDPHPPVRQDPTIKP